VQRSVAVLFFPRVETGIELGKVAMQVLLTNIMVYTVDAAFQSSKITRYRVRGDADAVFVPHVFISSVIQLIVLAGKEHPLVRNC
jgi:hypothetical protein